MTLALTLLVATAAVPTPVNVLDWVRFRYDYHREAWALTCYGYSNKAAAQRFKRLFGKRMERAERLAVQRFTAVTIKETREREYGGSVMIGGCRRDRTDQDVERKFRQRLSAFERAQRLDARR